MAAPRLTIPQQLADASDEDDYDERLQWLAALPAVVEEVAASWQLELGEPYIPGGQCAWVAPARDAAGAELVLKVGWRHREAEHEADALRFLNGDGAVNCFRTEALEDTTILLLERCTPGVQLKCALPEPEQDVVLAGLLRRVWARTPPPGHPFRPLRQVCDEWADSFELHFAPGSRRAGAGLDPGLGAGLDPGLVRDALAVFRELPRTADRDVLLCTDLHAGNILSSQREPWLVIDPKPYIGDPAYDAVQHMLNCDERLAKDPVGLARRMAELLELDASRVALWLFARCVQESVYDRTMREPAARLAP